MDRPNIIIVIASDMGQHLGCYGYADVRSPNVDGFAQTGVRFANSFCTAPQCSPSRATLWTGRFAHANGVVGLAHGGFANDLNPGERHLSRILRDAGYETHLFGSQHETLAPGDVGHEHMVQGGTCDEVASNFAEFLEQRGVGERPLFVEMGFFEAHRPFPHNGVDAQPHDQMIVPPHLPDIPIIREDLSEMGASISTMDRAVGRILEAVRTSSIADNTIVVFTVDHGAPFPRAKMTLYDPGIEVPLIIAGPGVPAGVVRGEMISNVDLLPTLLELAGLPLPSNLHGQSFRGLLTGGDYMPNEAVFAEKTYHTYYDPMRAIRTDRWKLIANFEHAPSQETSPDYADNAKGYVETARAMNVPCDALYHPPFELFDLESDPHEQHNLADDPAHRDTRDELIRALHDWMARTEDPLLEGPLPQGAYKRRMAAFREIAHTD